jgi:hypothetical protein
MEMAQAHMIAMSPPDYFRLGAVDQVKYTGIMVQATDEKDPLSCFIQPLELVGHVFLPQLVLDRTRMILVGLKIGLAVRIMADSVEGIRIRHGRPVQGIAFRVTVNEVDGYIL